MRPRLLEPALVHHPVQPDGHFVWWPGRGELALDPVARELLGLDPSAASGRLPSTLLGELSGEVWLEELGVGPSPELLARLSAGFTAAVGGRRRRFNARVVDVQDSLPSVLAGTIRATDPPRHAQGSTEQRVTRLDLLRQLSDSVLREEEPENTVAVAVSGLSGLFPDCRILASRIDRDGQMHIQLDQHPEGQPDIAGAVIDLRGAPGYLANLRGPGWLVCPDVAREGILAPLAPALAQLGVFAVVDAVYDDVDGEVSLICVDAPAPRIWPEGELETVRAIAGQLWVAREHARARAARQQAEAQLRRAQRVDALGRLAGGIAHDFNNMLQAISMNATEARHAVEAYDRGLATECLDEIDTVGRSAARLTRRLLTFTRTGAAALRPRPLPAARFLDDVVAMLRRLLPADRTLVADSLPELELHADPGQLEQALVNLVLNARQATVPGGRIELSARAAVPPPGLRASFELPPLPHVVLAVSDDGCGIAADDLDRVFEPFFTTRPVGEGTGLGLAMVWATARHHGGAVTVDSAVGVGTRVELWLPASGMTLSETDSGPVQALDAPVPAGLVLLAEDDASVARALVRGLDRLGVQVRHVADGHAALAELLGRPCDYAAAILDVVMPGPSGVDVLRAVRAAGHSLPVVLSSGHPGPMSLVPDDDRVAFIGKPCTAERLAATLAELLEVAARA